MNTKRSVQMGALLLLSGAVVALTVRSQVGIGSWGDEAYGLTTTLRYLHGDRPLVDSWDTNFSSAILAMPFAFLYTSLKGSTTGILLAYRWVWVTLQLVTAGLGYLALRKHLGSTLSVLMAALLVVYLPFLSPYVGYGADWSWHMLSAFVAVLAFDAKGTARWPWYLAGLLSGLGIVGNPPTVVVIVAFATGILTAQRAPGGSSQPGAVLAYFGGVLTVGAGFAVAMLGLSGTEFLRFRDAWSDPDDHDFSIAAYLTRLATAWLPIASVAIGGLLGGAVGSSGDRWLGRALALSLTLAALCLGVVTGTVGMIHAPQYLVMAAGSSLLVADTIGHRRPVASPQYLLLMPALGAGIGWMLGSNAGLATASLAAPLVLSAALVDWSTVQPTLDIDVARAASMSLLCLLILLVAAVGIRYTPEGVTFRMRSRMRNGPFAGIYGTSEEVERIEFIRTDLARLPPIKGRIAFFERFPLGYLMVPNAPGTPSTWSTPADCVRLRTYIARTGDAPDRLVLTIFDMRLRPEATPSGIGTLGLDGYREVFSDEYMTVFDRIR